MQVNGHEAKSQFSRLVDAACRGEEVMHLSPDFDTPLHEHELDEFLGA